MSRVDFSTDIGTFLGSKYLPEMYLDPLKRQASAPIFLGHRNRLSSLGPGSQKNERDPCVPYNEQSQWKTLCPLPGSSRSSQSNSTGKYQDPPCTLNRGSGVYRGEMEGPGTCIIDQLQPCCKTQEPGTQVMRKGTVG